MALEITTYPNNPNAWKSFIVAEYEGVSVKENSANFQWGVTNTSEEYLSYSPLGKVPALKTPEGGVFESNAMAFYVAKSANSSSTLLGKNVYEESLIKSWMDFQQNYLQPIQAKIVYPFIGIAPYNPGVVKTGEEEYKKNIGALNNYLATKTFLVGERITLADICVVMGLHRMLSIYADESMRTPYPNLIRYVSTVMNQPQVKKVCGEMKFAEKKPEAPKKDNKEAKKEEPKKEQPKKEAQPDAEAKPEKKKNPLDLLPPTEFVMDTWKRYYSNHEEKDAIKYFWENLDRNGYSVWKCSFKYNEENKKIFMSCNLLNGYFQRAESARKYAFGSFGIFGEDDDNEIHGIWLFRGQDIPFEIKDTPDSESYEFTKFENLDDENTKKQINAFLAWDELGGLGEFTGITKKFNQGKNYK